MNDLKHQTDRAWIEINASHLEHNLKQLEQAATGSKIMAVVKDRFYGLGIDAVILLQTLGVDHFAVATIDEALQLRFVGISKPILILGPTSADRFLELYHYDLIQSILTPQLGDQLKAFTELHKIKLKVHIKINTGMNRLGLSVQNTQDQQEITSYYTHPYLQVLGTFTHLLAADQFDQHGDEMCRLQLERFQQFLDFLEKQQLEAGHTHVFNSSGIMRYGQEFQFDYCRPGLYFAGTKVFAGFKTAFSLKARIAMIKRLSAKEQIGYGYENQLNQATTVATVSIGYGDGLQRRLAALGYKPFIDNTPCPILGRICMDLLMVDVQALSSPRVGDEVLLIGEPFTLEEMADLLGSIPNEVMTQFSVRIPRILI